MGEIFLILKQERCRAPGQNELLSQISCNEDEFSSENACLSSPRCSAATWGGAGTCSMAGDRTSEEMDKEEEDLRNDALFKAHRLSSPKPSDFQGAEMFAKNFATFLSNMKSDLSDEMRLGTEEEEEKERFTVQSDYNEVHEIDRNPVNALSLETDRLLNIFNLTHSGKSLRIPSLSRNESKWTADLVHRDGLAGHVHQDGFADHIYRDGLADHVHQDGLALSTTAALADCNFKKSRGHEEDHLQTCYSVYSSRSASNVMPFKTINDKSPVNYSRTEKIPLAIHNTLSGDGDKIYNCGNVLHAEDKFSSKEQEIKEFRPLHMQTTALNDGVTLKTCCCTPEEYSNTLPNVGIGRTFGTGNDLEIDSVNHRRFKQPVQSLTLDGNNFSVQKSNGNFWSHARSSRPCKFTKLSPLVLL